MELNLEQIKKVLKNRVIYPVIIMYVIILSLTAFAIYTGTKVYTLYTDLQNVTAEVEVSKSSVELIQKNQNLLQNNIDEYNAILLKAIPDDETYFSVISALEKLATNTGIEIVKYSIDLEATTQSKLTLSVDVLGSPEALDILYEKYRYAGGRLITSDMVTINKLAEGRIVMSFNFYHGKQSKEIDITTQQLTEKDIEFVKQVEVELQ